MAIFSAQHYNAIAACLSELTEDDDVVGALIEMFQNDNPNFDEELFLKKAGLSGGDDE